MATFYFNAAVDSDWQTLGNWWMSYDAETHSLSVPATSLPTSTDDIVVFGELGGSGLTVANAVFGVLPVPYGYYNSGYVGWGCLITVTGLCEFNSDESGNFTWNQGTVNGNVRFNYYIADSAGRVGSNWYASGVVTGAVLDANNNPISTWVFSDLGGVDQLWGVAQGDCIFNGGSDTSGTVTGNATFNDYSVGHCYISGNATFNDNSACSSGTILGNATFNDWSEWLGGALQGDATFNDSSRPAGGETYGDLTLNTTQLDRNTLSWIYVGGSVRFSVPAAETLLGGVVIYEKGINGSSILGVV